MHSAAQVQVCPPVEFPTGLLLAVNLRTANSCG